MSNGLPRLCQAVGCSEPLGPYAKKFHSVVCSNGATRKKRSELIKGYYANLDREKYQVWIEKARGGIKTYWTTLSEEERQADRKRRSKNAKNYLNNLTEEERMANIKKINEGYQNHLTNLTKEKRREISRKQSESHYAHLASLTKEQRREFSINRKARQHPNGQESWLATILPPPPHVVYTGDGSYIIPLSEKRYKKPDFLVVIWQWFLLPFPILKVIELFGDYWHNPEEEPKLKQLYAEVGIDCFIIWSWELRNKDRLAQLRDFVESGEHK